MVESRTSALVEAAPAARATRLQALDWMRFTAAASVVGFHYLFAGPNEGLVDYGATAFAKYGYFGVDLFFLISGFVIANSARGKTARQFAVGRAVRLYPAFWVAVLLTAAATVAVDGHFSVTGPQVLANLTMVHQLLGQPSVDGVYWTLFKELQFYALVAILLLVGLGRHLYRFFPLWALGMLGISILSATLGQAPLMGGYFAYFASGAIIATLRDRGWGWLQGVGLLAGFVVTIRYTLTTMIPDLEASRSVDYSETAVCIAVVGFHLLLLSFCVSRLANLRLPGSRRAGALTYPLYLVHQNIGLMLLATFAAPTNQWWVVAGVAALMLLVAWALNELVEVRLGEFWRTVFDRTAGAAVGAADRVLKRRGSGDEPKIPQHGHNGVDDRSVRPRRGSWVGGLADRRSPVERRRLVEPDGPVRQD